jgi:hypothetical protein
MNEGKEGREEMETGPIEGRRRRKKDEAHLLCWEVIAWRR